MLYSRLARAMSWAKLNPVIDAYEEQPQTQSYEREGWPASSSFGVSFRNGVAPVHGTGRGLINDPLPVELPHRLTPEVDMIGWQYFQMGAAIPVQQLGPYAGALPIDQFPSVPVEMPWIESDPMTFVSGK
ncbi:MAG TPA: hypothetical protein VK807_23335 [Gemmatimonadaceae bacterium]|jgi:hypothetical protein|nr:hypothetical protein [Gemmatimonadaceae bacterium]